VNIENLEGGSYGIFKRTILAFIRIESKFMKNSAKALTWYMLNPSLEITARF
jgi:hypothetical protein